MILVKRVIGLPNETIECRDNVVYINGEALDEPYLDSDYVHDIEIIRDISPVTLRRSSWAAMNTS